METSADSEAAQSALGLTHYPVSAHQQMVARSAPSFEDYAVPSAQREQERQYYMFVYKTRPCAGYPFNCQCDGLDYHSESERRRGPEIRYAPM